MTTHKIGNRGLVRVVVGPYNTTSKTGDIWKVKQLLEKCAQESKKQCPTCGRKR